MEMDQFPMKNSNSNSKSKSKILEEDEEEPILSRTKRQAPYIIFPEILCIIDYDGYRWKSTSLELLNSVLVDFSPYSSGKGLIQRFNQTSSITTVTGETQLNIFTIVLWT